MTLSTEINLLFFFFFFLSFLFLLCSAIPIPFQFFHIQIHKKNLLHIPVDTIENFNVSTEQLNEDNEDDESAEEVEEEENVEKESIDDLWTESRDDKGIDVAIPQLDKGQIISDELNEMAAFRQVSLESKVTTERTATTSTSTDVETLNSTKGQIKVSTACGPSPDREIEEIFSNEKSIRVLSPSVMRENPSRSSKVSIGTSPPPQTISTQVGKKNYCYFYS